MSNVQVVRLPGFSIHAERFTPVWPVRRIIINKTADTKHPPHLDIGYWTLDIGYSYFPHPITFPLISPSTASR